MKYWYVLALAALMVAQSCSKNSSDPTPTNPGDTTATSTLATLRTDSVGMVTDTSATIYTAVTAEGSSAVVAVGIAWGTKPNPTTFTGNAPAAGFGMGAFSVKIKGLQDSTTYYARPYATNATGT